MIARADGAVLIAFLAVASPGPPLTIETRPLGELPAPVTFSPFEGTSIGVEPDPPPRGETATLVVDVVNRDARARTVSVRVDIGAAALLHRAPAGATLVPRPALERNDPRLGVVWPRLVVPARSVSRLGCAVVLRSEHAANWLGARATVTDAQDGRTAGVDLGVETRWPDVERPGRPLLGRIAVGLALSILLWPTAALIARLGQGRHGFAPRLIAVLYLIVGTALTVAFVLAWWSDMTSGRDERAATCRVTDRMLLYESSSDERRDHWRGTTYRYRYRPLFAVDLMTAGASRPVISGDSDTIVFAYADQEALRELERFQVGGEYPCWYSTRDPQELLLEPRAQAVKPFTLGSVGLFLLMASPGLLARAWRRRHRG